MRRNKLSFNILDKLVLIAMKKKIGMVKTYADLLNMVSFIIEIIGQLEFGGNEQIEIGNKNWLLKSEKCLLTYILFLKLKETYKTINKHYSLELAWYLALVI